MKMNALLCRTIYDARDLVDLFVLKKHAGISASFSKLECDMIENNFDERLDDIKRTKRKNLLIFQTEDQIGDLPYNEFEKYKRWLYDWLSGFR